MLVGLNLRNIALIDSLELTFEKGFTVLTGETGAGKSLLLDALDVLFYGSQSSSSTKLIRSGSDKAHIEATFFLDQPIKGFFEEEHLGLEDNHVMISREWRCLADRTTSRSRVNGTLINRNELIKLRPFFIDLTLQDQASQLIDSSDQLHSLDKFGSEDINPILKNVKESWLRWKNINNKLLNERSINNHSKHQMQQYKEIFLDLQSAELEDPDEDKYLENEQEILANSVRLKEGISGLLINFNEGSDQLPSQLEQLSNSIHQLQSLTKLDQSLSISFDKILDLQADMQSLITDLDQYGFRLENNSSRLEELQDRLAFLKRLQRRYNSDLPSLITKRNALNKLIFSEDNNASLKDLEKQENLARLKRDESNQLLSACRLKLALRFENLLLKELRPLGLQNVRFKVQISESIPTEFGADSVNFLFSANPGQPLAPLSQVASGGEMSRFLLAFKKVLLTKDNGPFTILFDEIDSGVSGRISGEIAQVLKDLSSHRQVFCITHQPLIAAYADNHFAVTKSVIDGITYSKVSSLDNLAARKKELAQLAGGDFDDAQIYAGSLLAKKAA